MGFSRPIKRKYSINDWLQCAIREGTVPAFLELCSHRYFFLKGARFHNRIDDAEMPVHEQVDRQHAFGAAKNSHLNETSAGNKRASSVTESSPPCELMKSANA